MRLCSDRVPYSCMYSRDSVKPASREEDDVEALRCWPVRHCAHDDDLLGNP